MLMEKIPVGMDFLFILLHPALSSGSERQGHLKQIVESELEELRLSCRYYISALCLNSGRKNYGAPVYFGGRKEIESYLKQHLPSCSPCKEAYMRRIGGMPELDFLGMLARNNPE